jgi:hypothetical protein
MPRPSGTVAEVKKSCPSPNAAPADLSNSQATACLPETRKSPACSDVAHVMLPARKPAEGAQDRAGSLMIIASTEGTEAAMKLQRGTRGSTDRQNAHIRRGVGFGHLHRIPSSPVSVMRSRVHSSLLYGGKTLLGSEHATAVKSAALQQPQLHQSFRAPGLQPAGAHLEQLQSTTLAAFACSKSSCCFFIPLFDISHLHFCDSKCNTLMPRCTFL